jgi:hypothetical protein
MPISPLDLLKPERDLPGSLPPCPVSEEGINILKANMVELGESDTLWQVLGEDVALLQSGS